MKIFTGILIGITLALIGVATNNIQIVTSLPKIQSEEGQSCKDIVSQFSTLFQATSEIGQIPYNSSFSDCYDHSKLLTKELEKRNIRSSIMVNKDRSHAWVAVWIEATSGQFVPIENGQQELLEIRDGTDITNVQCYNG